MDRGKCFLWQLSILLVLRISMPIPTDYGNYYETETVSQTTKIPAKSTEEDANTDKFIGLITGPMLMGAILSIGGWGLVLTSAVLWLLGQIDSWTGMLRTEDQNGSLYSPPTTQPGDTAQTCGSRFIERQFRAAPAFCWYLLRWISRGKKTQILFRVTLLLCGIVSIASLSVVIASESRGESVSDLLHTIVSYAQQEPMEGPQHQTLQGSEEQAESWDLYDWKMEKFEGSDWNMADIINSEGELDIMFDENEGGTIICDSSKICHKLLETITRAKLLACISNRDKLCEFSPGTTPAQTFPITAGSVLVLEEVTQADATRAATALPTTERLFRLRSSTTNATPQPTPATAPPHNGMGGTYNDMSQASGAAGVGGGSGLAWSGVPWSSLRTEYGMPRLPSRYAANTSSASCPCNYCWCSQHCYTPAYSYSQPYKSAV